MRLAVGQSPNLIHFGRSGLRNLVRDDLDDFHAVFRAPHELEVHQGRDLVSVREGIQQLLAQFAQDGQVLFREMILAFGEDADEIVVSEVGLELIGLHQHRISFDEIVVKGGLLHHLGHSDEGKHQDDGK